MKCRHCKVPITAHPVLPLVWVHDDGYTSCVLWPLQAEPEPHVCDCASIAACWCDVDQPCPPCSASRGEPHTCATDEERREFVPEPDVSERTSGLDYGTS